MPEHEHMLKCSAAEKHFMYYHQHFSIPELASSWRLNCWQQCHCSNSHCMGVRAVWKPNSLTIYSDRILQPYLVPLLYMKVTNLSQGSLVTIAIASYSLVYASVTKSSKGSLVLPQEDGCPRECSVVSWAHCSGALQCREGKMQNFRKSPQYSNLFSYILSCRSPREVVR